MKRITRERPETDRIASHGLGSRCVEASPELLCVPAGDVMRIAAETGTIPDDVPYAWCGNTPLQKAERLLGRK